MKVADLKARLASANDDSEVVIADVDGLVSHIDGVTVESDMVHLSMGDEVADPSEEPAEAGGES